MTLPKISGDKEDQDIADILSKLDNRELVKLQSWISNKVQPGLKPPPPIEDNSIPPPPPVVEKSKPAATRGMLFSEIQTGARLKSVEKPKEQQIVLPDPDLPMPEDEKRRGIL